MRSMTGYGKAEYKCDEYFLTVEIKTVNNRYLDLNPKYPRFMLALDDVIRRSVSKCVRRGKADLFISQIFADFYAFYIQESFASFFPVPQCGSAVVNNIFVTSGCGIFLKTREGKKEEKGNKAGEELRGDLQYGKRSIDIQIYQKGKTETVQTCLAEDNAVGVVCRHSCMGCV